MLSSNQTTELMGYRDATISEEQAARPRDKTNIDDNHL